MLLTDSLWNTYASGLGLLAKLCHELLVNCILTSICGRILHVSYHGLGKEENNVYTIVRVILVFWHLPFGQVRLEGKLKGRPSILMHIGDFIFEFFFGHRSN